MNRSNQQAGPVSRVPKPLNQETPREMKALNVINLLLLASAVLACAQTDNHTHQKTQTMNTNMIENKIVRRAFDAWQAGDSRLWLSLFTDNAKLYDDGHPRDFHKFSTEAIGHERFITIDKIEDNGTGVYGQFHSDVWGDFKTFFRFHIDHNGKIDRLEIGQADY